MVAHSRAERMTTRQFSKHTPEQIILTLGKGGQSQAESMNKADSCRLLISSDETLWRWLNQIRNLLRASHARLTKRQQGRLREAFVADEAHISVIVTYHCPQHVREVFHQATSAQGRHRAARLVERLPTCPVPEIARLGQTPRK